MGYLKDLWTEMCITKANSNIEKFKNISIVGNEVKEEYQDVTVTSKFKSEVDAKTYFDAMKTILKKVGYEVGK